MALNQIQVTITTFLILILGLTLTFISSSQAAAASLGQAEARRNRDGPSVVFIGDSLTSQWRTTGIETWLTYYSDFAVNTGVSGSTTTNVIRQINNGSLDPLNSTTIAILLIGGNDLQILTPGIEVAENIHEIILLIQSKLGDNIKILLLGLLPANVPSVIIEQGLIVKSIISTYDNYDQVETKRIKYLDMALHFVDEDGSIFWPLYSFDGVHLSEEGYEVWAQSMDPTLQELLLINDN